jgi:hypothetical protein
MGERPSDAEYYRNREVSERELALFASDPAVRAAHMAMAERYAELVGREKARKASASV